MSDSVNVSHEILLTTFRHARGDAVVDRSWTPVKVRGGCFFQKPDGTMVRPIYSVMGCRCLPPRGMVHFGVGFEKWLLRDQSEAVALLRGKLFIDSKGAAL